MDILVKIKNKCISQWYNYKYLCWDRDRLYQLPTKLTGAPVGVSDGAPGEKTSFLQIKLYVKFS